MKLIYRIVIRISLLLTLVLGVWAVFFYMAMMDEVNDEVDDSLEDYSEIIIIRALAGEELPSQNTGQTINIILKKLLKNMRTAVRVLPIKIRWFIVWKRMKPNRDVV